MHRSFLLVGLFGLAIGAAAQTVPAGTRIEVRSNDTIHAYDTNPDGRVYTGVVANDVIGTDGNVVIPRGVPAELIVRRLGEHDLSIDLESVKVGERRFSIDAIPTDRTRREGVGDNQRTGAMVGGGALVGTLLGAIAGGGKGAVIGAVAGGAAGATGAAVTRGGSINIPAETVLSFRLEQPLNLYPDRGHDRNGYHYHDDYDRWDRPTDNRPAQR